MTSRPVRAAAVAACVAALVLLGCIVASSMEMGLMAGLAATVDTLWGVTTMVDLYVGLSFAAMWIIWREGARPRAWLWTLGLLLTGNLALAVYVLIAALRSPDLRSMFLGSRA